MIHALTGDFASTGAARDGFDRPSAVESHVRDVSDPHPGADVAARRHPDAVTSDAVAGSEFLDDRIRLLE